MIPNEEEQGWYYLALKKLSPLLRGIISKHDSDFYCLSCLFVQIDQAPTGKNVTYRNFCWCWNVP